MKHLKFKIESEFNDREEQGMYGSSCGVVKESCGFFGAIVTLVREHRRLKDIVYYGYTKDDAKGLTFTLTTGTAHFAKDGFRYGGRWFHFYWKCPTDDRVFSIYVNRLED